MTQKCFDFFVISVVIVVHRAFSDSLTFECICNIGAKTTNQWH